MTRFFEADPYVSEVEFTQNRVREARRPVTTTLVRRVGALAFAATVAGGPMVYAPRVAAEAVLACPKEAAPPSPVSGGQVVSGRASPALSSKAARATKFFKPLPLPDEEDVDYGF